MQVRLMNLLHQDSVPQEVIEREIEIGKDLAIQEGKPEKWLRKLLKAD